jgi:hypothetical protein
MFCGLGYEIWKNSEGVPKTPFYANSVSGTEKAVVF